MIALPTRPLATVATALLLAMSLLTPAPALAQDTSPAALGLAPVVVEGDATPETLDVGETPAEGEIPSTPEPVATDGEPGDRVDDERTDLDDATDEPVADDAVDAMDDDALNPPVVPGDLAKEGLATRVSTGQNHALYIGDDGQIWSWGSNTRGQLGNGTTTSSTSPVRVDMLGELAGHEVVAVSVGAHHSLALTRDGAVFAWGSNDNGQLGIGNTTAQSRPRQVTGFPAGVRIVQIEAGFGTLGSGAERSRSHALGDDGRLYSWGSGQWGALGIGSTANRTTPTVVGGLLANLRAVQVTAGQSSTFVLTDSGRVFSWGTRQTGQLGNGTNASTNQTSPVEITSSGALSGRRAVQISAGQSIQFALTDQGEVLGWGGNTVGQMAGAATATIVTRPVLIDPALFADLGITPVSVTAGLSSGFVIGAGGEVAGWGDNASGQLGVGTTVGSAVPARVDLSGLELGEAGDRVVQLAPGSGRGRSPLALTVGGRLVSWGMNDQGQVGDGGTTNVLSPAEVGPWPVVAVHPQDQTVQVGESAVFSAAARGTAEGWSQQWQVSEDGSTWTDIAGATGTTYTLEGATDAVDGSRYRAVFANSVGSRTTNSAALTVQRPGWTGPPVHLTVTPRVLLVDSLPGRG